MKKLRKWLGKLCLTIANNSTKILWVLGVIFGILLVSSFVVPNGRIQLTLVWIALLVSILISTVNNFSSYI